MGSLEERLNRNLSPEVEKYVMNEFHYILQLTGCFAYLRGRWLYVSIVWSFILISLIAMGCVQFGLGALGTIDYQFGLASLQIHAVCGCTLVAITLTLLAIKRPLFIEIFSKFYSPFKYNKYYTDTKAQLLIDRAKKKKSRMVTGYAIHFLLMGLQVSVGSEILDRIQGTTPTEDYIGNIYMKIPLACWFPVKLEGSFAYYLFYFHLVLLCMAILCPLLALLLLVFDLYDKVNIELHILIDSIEHIEERALNSCLDKYKGFDKMELKLFQDERFLAEYELCMKENFRHHQVIKRLQWLVDDLQRWPLFLTTFNLSVALACGFLSVMKGDRRLSPQIDSLLLLIMEIVSITIISKRGQELLDLGEKLFKSFYKTRWIYLPPNLKLSMKIFQESTKNYMSYRAGGMTQINWEFYSSIMNTAYTYFNLIFAMNDD